MMQLTAASLGALLLLPQPARAGTVNANIMQNFMEKLGLMAGFSKPENETEDKNVKSADKEPAPTSQEPTTEAKRVETEENNAKEKEAAKEISVTPTTAKQSKETEQPKEDPPAPALPSILNDTKKIQPTLPL